MNRPGKAASTPTAVSRGAVPGYKPQLPGRVPQQFIEAMKLLQGKPADTNIKASDMAAARQAAHRRTVQPPLNKWKSSFQPIDGSDDSEDKGAVMTHHLTISQCSAQRNTKNLQVYISDPTGLTEHVKVHYSTITRRLNTYNLEQLPGENLFCLKGHGICMTEVCKTTSKQTTRRLDQSFLDRVELYDPYSPVLLDSELEMPDSSHCLLDKDNTLRRSLSPGTRCQRKSRWNCSDDGGQLFSPKTRPCENQGFSPGHRLSDKQTYSPDTESLDRTRYDNIGRPLDHRICSPDRTIHGSSTQQFSTSYGGRRSNGEERMTVPKYRREVSKMTAVRLSPPRLQREYHHQQGHVKSGPDHIKLSTEVTRNSQKIISMDKSPITCDLCEVELANGQELEDHLDSRSHWDTLEHIQQQNSYDDLAIAFLQEVMLYKSRQCSRAIEDSALQSLQKNDHMTKVEMFHCAACDIFVSTSASSVQAHITSQGHLSKTKEFEVQQRRACLNKAETIMKELKPQFEHFMQGGSPF